MVSSTIWGWGATGELMALAEGTALEHTVGYSYDGVQLHSVSESGVTTTFGYNGAGETDSTTWADSSGSIEDQITDRDEQGAVVALTHTSNGSTTSESWGYNDRYQLDSETLSHLRGVWTKYEYYEPDDASTGASAGQIKSVKLMLGQSTELYSASYQYDTSGRLWKVTANGTTYTYSYKDDTDLVESVTGGGMDTSFGYETDTNRLSTIDVSAGSNALYGAELGYHANDQRATELTSLTLPGGGSVSRNWSYGYNDQDQLTGVTNASTQQSLYGYSYDGVGNRTIAGAGAVNDLNQYSNWDYDARGNLLNDGVYPYTWDAQDHLSGVTAADHSAKATFGYDSSGRRAWKKSFTWDDSLNDGDGGWKLASHTRFAWNGSDLVAEFAVEADGTQHMTRSYAWGMGSQLLAVTTYEADGVTIHKTYLPIGREGIDCYRNDCNLYPLYFWRNGEPADRQGINEIRYITALYDYCDTLQRDHPRLLLDNCASGGRRIDFEMLRRALVLTRSDYLWDPIGQQCHTYGLAPWVPITGIGSDSPDSYKCRSGLGSHFVLAADFYSKDNAVWESIARAIKEYRSVKHFYTGDFYPLGSYSTATDAWMAWQFDRPDLGEGLVQAFRRQENLEETATFRLYGLSPAAEYSVVNTDEPSSRRMIGRELMEQGVTIKLRGKPSAALLIYRKVGR